MLPSLLLVMTLINFSPSQAVSPLSFLTTMLQNTLFSKGSSADALDSNREHWSPSSYLVPSCLHSQLQEMSASSRRVSSVAPSLFAAAILLKPLIASSAPVYPSHFWIRSCKIVLIAGLVPPSFQFLLVMLLCKPSLAYSFPRTFSGDDSLQIHTRKQCSPRLFW